MKAHIVNKQNNVAANYGLSNFIRRATPFFVLFTLLMACGATWKFFFDTISSFGYSDFKSSLFNLIISLLISVLLAIYLLNGIKGKRIRKISGGMRFSEFFNPKPDDEQTMPGNLEYVGLDFTTGMVGIGSVYQRGYNARKVLYFPCELIEHYHYEGNNLVLALRNREIPELRIQMLQARAFERKIEQASHMIGIFEQGRNCRAFKDRYQAMQKVDALIEPDY